MTIKRRIFLSNILMIAVSSILGVIIFFVARSFVLSDETQTRGGFGGRFTDFPDIPAISESLTSEAFTRGEFYYVTSARVYRSDLGDYIVILPDAQFDSMMNFLTQPVIVLPLIIVYLVVIFILANILIAKYITRTMMTPINVLAKGVKEISEGNLTHRVEYNGGDEFDAVCMDFNEMATRLLKMVEQKQADENSRKELIAGISHDLRTPLTSIKMSIEAIESKIATTHEKQEKYLNIIQRKTDDLEYIIEQLFMFSKIDIGEFPLNLEAIETKSYLEEFVNGCEEEYKKEGLEISLDVQASEVIKVDKVQLKNVLHNILGNSVKYCENQSPHVQITCHKANEDNIEIIIKDNGHGVSEETLTKMFDVFYRGDMSRGNTIKGSGLGLAISAKIVARMGGGIKAENANGLAIIIALPINKAEGGS